MKPSVGARLDQLARQLTPFALTVLAALFSVLPLHVPAWPAVAPAWALIAIYHWSLFRPDLMPAAAVFVIGVLYDALSGAPIGLNAAVFVIVHGVAVAQCRFFSGKSFAILWLGFALVSAAALALAWGLACLWNGHLIDPRALVFQHLVTLGCFPLLSGALLVWQRSVLRRV